jgi:hypothetical protein
MRPSTVGRGLKMAKPCVNIHCDVDIDADHSEVPPEWMGIFQALCL